MRHAVYFTPVPDSDLASLAKQWLMREHPLMAGPRRYGFHATLKAPFHLVEGKCEADLLQAVNRLAQDLEATDIGKFELSVSERFLSLRPSNWTAAAQAIADEVVVSLDHLRAPLSQADLERRRAAKLTPAGDALLVKYGYPHVLKEFRFHMTLSEAAGDVELAKLAQEAADWFAGPLSKIHHLDRLSVMREPHPGAVFELVEQFELRHEGPWPELWKWSAA